MSLREFCQQPGHTELAGFHKAQLPGNGYVVSFDFQVRVVRSGSDPAPIHSPSSSANSTGSTSPLENAIFLTQDSVTGLSSIITDSGTEFVGA